MDYLYAGAAGDILVAGTTNGDDTGLQAIVNTWKTVTNNATAKVARAAIKTGGLSVSADVPATRDILYGSPTTDAVDWFLYSAAEDLVTRAGVEDLKNWT